MIFVFRVRMRPGTPPERYAEAWIRASRIIQTAPGARGTRLHRKLDEPDVLLAIASWESPAARDAAERARDPRVQEILDAQAESVEIEILGAFDDPEWTVLPPQDGDAAAAERRVSGADARQP